MKSAEKKSVKERRVEEGSRYEQTLRGSSEE
jgi:hypothetical protein